MILQNYLLIASEGEQLLDLAFGRNMIFLIDKAPCFDKRINGGVKRPAGLTGHFQCKLKQFLCFRAERHCIPSAVIYCVNLAVFICGRPQGLPFYDTVFRLIQCGFCLVPISGQVHIRTHGKESGRMSSIGYLL